MQQHFRPSVAFDGAASGVRGKLSRIAHQNHVLDALEPELQCRLGEHLERIHLEPNAVLYDHTAPSRFVYFPETCVLSLISTDANGATLAVGTFGSESIIVVPAAFDRFGGSLQMIAHVPGNVLRIETGVFEAIFQSSKALRDVLLADAQTFALHVAQVGTCNALHTMRERCIRALLMLRDRLSSDTFELTHDALASIVGARRASVTVAMIALKDAGLIAYRRKQIRIVDRAGLETGACSCVPILQRLVPERRST